MLKQGNVFTPVCDSVHGGSLSRRSPWTEIPLDRDPHWTETPWTETPLDRDPMDRDPPGQRHLRLSHSSNAAC